MSLPPLANFLAVRRDDPREADELERAFRGDARFDEVWRPARGWVVGVKPLPHGVPDAAETRAAGLVFAEGRDVTGAHERGGAERVAALARERPERLAELPGDFTFLAFAPDGAVTAVRSAGGLAPLYVAEGGAVLATRLKWTVPFLARPRVDPFVTGMFTWGWVMCPDGRTPVEGVSVLRRGRYARVTADGVSTGAYWDPRPDRLPRPSPERQAEHVERFRSMLLERLAVDLDPAGGNWLMFSGGVDSASLAALAAGTLGLPLSAVTLGPPFPEDQERERGLWRILERRAPFERHEVFPMAEPELLTRARAASASGFPLPHPVMQEALRLQREEGADVRVVLGGGFGDEVGGSHFNVPDWVSLTSLGRLLAHPGRAPYGLGGIARWVKWRAAALAGRPYLPYPDQAAEYLQPQVRDAYADWLARLRRSVRRDRRPLWHLETRLEMLEATLMHWEGCSEQGVRHCAPFITRAGIELAFECHPEELVGPGLRKLQTAALREDVPAANLQVAKPKWRLAPATPVPFDGTLPPAAAAVVREDWVPRPAGSLAPHLARRLWILQRFLESSGLQEGDDPAEADNPRAP